jgi:hypothetical protein
MLLFNHTINNIKLQDKINILSVNLKLQFFLFIKFQKSNQDKMRISILKWKKYQIKDINKILFNHFEM